MKRLGKFTGKIYEEDYDFSNCPECCSIQITDEQAKDEEFIKQRHIKDLVSCITCMGCPAAQKGVIGK